MTNYDTYTIHVLVETENSLTCTPNIHKLSNIHNEKNYPNTLLLKYYKGVIYKYFSFFSLVRISRSFSISLGLVYADILSLHGNLMGFLNIIFENEKLS